MRQAEALEVLLARRHPCSRWMPDNWVFPGGTLTGADRKTPDPRRAAARRELAEEATVDLPDAEPLHAFARWLTPEALPVRFDATYFAALLPTAADPKPDGREIAELGWFRPAAATANAGRDSMTIPFPTLCTLEDLGRCADWPAVVSAAAGDDARGVLPEIVLRGGRPQVILPE